MPSAFSTGFSSGFGSQLGFSETSIKKNGAYGPIADAGLKVKLGGQYVSASDLTLKINGVYIGGVTPANTVAPTLAGVAAIGEILTCTPGTWVGTAEVIVSHSWKADDVVIPGTGLTHVVQATDVGKTVRCVERATNAFGSITQDTNGIFIPGAFSVAFNNDFDGGI